MKRHFKILILLFFSSLKLFGQYGDINEQALNLTKDRVLFRQSDTNKIIYYDLLTNKIIKSYEIKKYSLDSYDCFVGFSPNNKMFYILNIFGDTNFVDKNWKPNKFKYAPAYLSHFGNDTNWQVDKAVTLSTCNFYSTENGEFLFSLKDTGFYYEDFRSRDGVPTVVIRNYKLPCYIDCVNFFENSDSLLIVSTNNGFEYSNRKRSIWNLKTQKNIFGYNNKIDYDMKLTSDKKYYYRFYNPHYYPGNGRTPDTYNNYNKIDVFSSKDFTVIKRNDTNKIKFIFQKNESFYTTEHLAFDNNNKPLQITEIIKYNEKNANCRKYLKITNLTLDSLIFESDIFNCDSSIYSRIPKSITINKENYGVTLNDLNKQWYSNDSIVEMEFINDTTLQLFNSKTLKPISQILFKDKYYRYNWHYTFVNDRKILFYQYKKVIAIYEIDKDKLIYLKDIKTQE